MLGSILLQASCITWDHSKVLRDAGGKRPCPVSPQKGY